MVMMQVNRLLSVALFVGAGVVAAAQSGVAPNGIDLSLLTKANGGDASAEVAVGEQLARAATMEHDRTRLAEDYRQELAWYLKAAEQKDVSAELHLAALYRDGGGDTIARNMEQAAAWYRKAAEQGDASAQGTLGLLYTMGQGVPRDDVEAYFWLDLAARARGPNQQKYAANRQLVGEHITAEELAGVEDRVTAWETAHPVTKPRQ